MDMDESEQMSSLGPKRHSKNQASKAKVMTRGQRLQGFKKGATPSWMKDGVCLDKNILRGEQLKYWTCVDDLCWVKQRCRPERGEISSFGII